MLEPDLIAFMAANLTDIPGGVHLGNVPQDSPPPAVSVTLISSSTGRTLGNVALFSGANLQVLVVGDDRYAPVMVAANQIRKLLDGFKGAWNQTRVESCRCVADPADQSVVDGNKVIRALSLDFKVTYREL